jgi:hypothetical protein
MGNRCSYFSKANKTVTIAVQAALLKRLFPDSKVTLNKNFSLAWIGQLQPSALSNLYKIKIKYWLKEKPEVTVIEPQLQTRDGSGPPHVFPGNRLCLFRLKYGEWDPTMPIAETIVPWTSLWLLYYEIWLVTGKWCGSNQEHPAPSEKKKKEA